MQLTDQCFINRTLLNQALFENAHNTADNSCACLNDGGHFKFKNIFQSLIFVCMYNLNTNRTDNLMRPLQNLVNVLARPPPPPSTH